MTGHEGWGTPDARWQATRIVLHPLVLLGLLVALVLVLVEIIPFPVERSVVQPTVGFFIISAYLSAASVIVVRTGKDFWSYLGAGLVGAFVGDAMFFMRIMTGVVAWDMPIVDVRPVIRSELWLHLVESLLFVGGMFVIVGLVWEWKLDHQQKMSRIEGGYRHDKHFRD